ncbi:MAG: methyltransferase domain-containing protein [Paracoccus sp. (in: a-proteobacteria)]
MSTDGQTGFIHELLMAMPLSAQHVLICDGKGLSSAYRARNPMAMVNGMGMTDREGVDCLISGDPAKISKMRMAGFDRNQTYDLIVLNGTLGRLSNPAPMLRRMRALLKPGGCLIACERNAGHWSILRDQFLGRGGNQGALGAEVLPAILKDAGFTQHRLVARREQADSDMAKLWLARLIGLGETAKLSPERLDSRLRASHLICVATHAPEADTGMSLSPLRLHQIVLADKMDIRTRIPVTALAAEPELVVTTTSKFLSVPDMGARGGVVIVQRPRISDPKQMLNFTAECQRRGIVMVLEYDDDPSLVARTLPREDVPEIYDYNYALCHAIQTSTEVLAHKFGRVNPEVRVFANGAEDLAPLSGHEPGPVRVLIAALNRSRMQELATYLRPAIDELPDAQFGVIFDREFFDALPTDRKIYYPLLEYDQYMGALKHADIALMPLEGLPDELGKSDVKWVEAASRSAVAIASPAVYAKTIRHGENGFIATEPEDWSRILIQLANDHDLRSRVSATAYDEVARNRMMAGQVAERRNWYQSLMERREELFAGAVRRSPALAAVLGKGFSV